MRTERSASVDTAMLDLTGQLRYSSLQYLKVMTNVPIGHPFGRLAVQGRLRYPLLLAPIAKGRSYLNHVSLSR